MEKKNTKTVEATKGTTPKFDLNDSKLYLNLEVTWLE